MTQDTVLWTRLCLRQQETCEGNRPTPQPWAAHSTKKIPLAWRRKLSAKGGGLFPQERKGKNKRVRSDIWQSYLRPAILPKSLQGNPHERKEISIGNIWKKKRGEQDTKRKETGIKSPANFIIPQGHFTFLVGYLVRGGKKKGQTCVRRKKKEERREKVTQDNKLSRCQRPGERRFLNRHPLKGSLPNKNRNKSHEPNFRGRGVEGSETKEKSESQVKPQGHDQNVKGDTVKDAIAITGQGKEGESNSRYRAKACAMED